MKLFLLRFKTGLLFCCLFFTAEFGIAQHSVAHDWNEILLEAIRNDFARPTVHARNLFHHSIIAYDGWAAYEPHRDTYFLGKTTHGYHCDYAGINIPLDIESARNETISYASYFFIKSRYQNSPDYFHTYNLMYNYMVQHGYNTNNLSTDYINGGPAEFGNYLAQELINYGYGDGSNELLNYENTYYTPINPPLVMDDPGNPDIIDPNRWQSLTLDSAIDQSGNNVQNTIPFISPEWGVVDPFALNPSMYNTLSRDGQFYNVYFDTVQPAYLNPNDSSSWDSFYKWNHSLVSIWQSHLDPSDGITWDISPASIGNNTWYPTDSIEYSAFYDLLDGGDPSTGYAVNPITGQPYTPQVVSRADYARVLAEFWADGIDSETPPGHWFEIYHYVTDQPTFEWKWKGLGPQLDELEYDVKAHLALGGAMHDAAISAWSLKGYYDYIRPVSSIRYMTGKGQSSDPLLPSYDPHGIPLLTNFIELVDSLDPLAGNTYENVGKIKLFTWKGHEYINDPMIDVAGVGWILGENWWPYQRPTFVTPPFAGFVSGHSTYSRAAAEIMERITGSPYFPGGLGEFDAPQNEFLQFEEGPSTNITLQWASYRDASDQCSLSRIWGGIHPPIDDIPGRMIGGQVGEICFNKADSIFSNSQPALVSSIISDTIINSFDSGSSFGIDLTFNVPMDSSGLPQVDLSPVSLYQVLSSNQVYWIDSFQLHIEFDINNDLLEEFTSLIQIQGVDDGNGFHFPEIVLENYFLIDTKLPEINSISSMNFILSDIDIPSGYQTLIELNEPCNMSLTPDFFFSGTNYFNSTFNHNAQNSNWNSTQEYQANFNLADFNENVASVDVLIQNIEDIHGNPLLNPNGINICSIDTKNPNPTEVLLSDTLINIEDLNTNPQIDATVSFDEAMDTTIIPEFVLYDGTDIHSSITMNTFGTYWTDSSTLNTELWVFSDTNNLTYLELICLGAKDINGNAINDSITPSNLYSDLKEPHIEYALPVVPVISDSLIGSNLYYVDISYNEPMEPGTIPLIIHESNNDLSGSIQYNFIESHYLDDFNYRAFFNIIDENIETDSIGITIIHGRDFSGNTQTEHTENLFVSLDTKNPSIVNFTTSTNSLTLGDQLDISISFDEEMDTNQIIQFEYDPIITSPVELIQTNYNWGNTTNLNIQYELINSDVNPHSFDLNIIEGTDKAGNLLIPFGVDSVFSIPGSLGIENAMESIQIYPNLIHSGDQIVIKGNSFIQNTDFIKIYNGEGKLLKSTRFQKNGDLMCSPPLHIEPGMYYVQINNITRKLLVI